MIHRNATPGPSSEKILDVAVESTFPASDATAVGAAIHAAEDEHANSRPTSRPPAAPPGDFQFPRSPS